MKILIDADGCPVVKIASRVAEEYNIECVIFCDTAHIINLDNARTVTVSKGADSVDFCLVNSMDRGDIFITQDYGLAAMGLARGGVGIHQNGYLYTEENIDGLLTARHAAKKAAAAGKRFSSIPKRRREDDGAFERTLRGVLDSIGRQ